MPASPFATLSRFTPPGQQAVWFHSLPALAAAGFARLGRLPVSLRIVLEALLRHCDGHRVTAQHVADLANWQPCEERSAEIPFVVARVVLQDFTGVPLLCDLAAMRHETRRRGLDPRRIEPLVPVDLVVDHSVQVDHYGTPLALQQNMAREFERNRERYQFLKWGMQAFESFRVVPPGVGIVHQVNLEHLFGGVHHRPTSDGRLCFPDTLVGTDSHTTMINALGVVGWGVGGIEAEAAMLGQPVYFLAPDVVGVELSGRLREGVTATDLVLTVTELLRREKVVGCFVEFFGDGASALPVTDRATLANMAPEYGATMGFFPVDEQTVAYLRSTGRSDEECALFEAYFRAQQLFGIPRAGEIDYSRNVRLDLSTIVPSLAGPRRPQDRVALPEMARRFDELFVAAESAGGFGRLAESLAERHPSDLPGVDVGHGDVLIAAITSCTNTSNPAVMIAAGLLARKAIERGLSVRRHVKTSLAPGSRVVTDYLAKAGLLEPLAELGFALAGYGCTTCIGNSGDLDPALNKAIAEHRLIAAAVLSGNRNFEARIHPNLRANYLASPPLVVAFAIAGRVNIDLSSEPLGVGRAGEPVFLRDVWPSSDEISALLPFAFDPQTFRRRYTDFAADHELWRAIPAPQGDLYDWPESTYIARPPFLDLAEQPVGDIRGAKALLILGDSVTTDHISPAGSFGEATPAGSWLRERGVDRADFNSYGARRGHHEVMTRGTFANVRLRNLMLPADVDGRRREGGYTLLDGQLVSVFEAASSHMRCGTPTLVFAGEEYGTGSSRDWAAKGTRLLGVRAVIARSFERIHRANLVGMGVLPLQFTGDDSVLTLGLTGGESFAIVGLGERLAPRQTLTLIVEHADGRVVERPLLSRIDTPVEVRYYLAGGILPHVLEQVLSGSSGTG
ncbi:aconitate hydratase AcnA [Accumulibacter sp.]|uniref:aconitate hydratase AcnA n=1 Tax=Accumulibacter sp. TaxID=2053492 RepID=UPI0025F0143C|nr:aconitate hydratase AcnA [Accumulibacter sp.]MCM8593989.1 aconitate hydratase AcnA [Accumulibacter sp.]MCM8624806.1 aconitate hydratase AcnA [Accumulibacter sp.]MDS4048131.1 aconitate hydratase AcnA [Accumulibacter sp.]